MKLTSRIVLFVSTALLTSCAHAPAQEHANRSTAPAAATGASSAAQTTTDSHSARGRDATSDSQQNGASANEPKKVIHVSKQYVRRLANVGFYPKNQDGQLIFCRKQTSLGTRFEHEVCMDNEQLAMFLERSEDQRQSMQRQNCVGPPMCGGGQ